MDVSPHVWTFRPMDVSPHGARTWGEMSIGVAGRNVYGRPWGKTSMGEWPMGRNV